MNVSEMSGQTVGNGQYKLLVRLGKGNFGTVYRAQELMDGAFIREVALKIYSPEATRLGKVEGRLQDCALPAKILASEAPLEQKQHFVPIYSFGCMDTPCGNCAYVSMELVRNGDTLDDLFKRYKAAGRLPKADMVIDYMKQFFCALSLAHKAGVLHRDIKGANVMVVDGILKIMDFGMGAYLDRPETPLKTTMSIYAPENFDGRYTESSDIYQAGLMFYKFYTGRDPYEDKFGGEINMLEERKKRLDFVFLAGSSLKGTDDSPLLNAVLSKCLSYAELARYSGSCEKVLKALEGTDVVGTAEHAVRTGDFSFTLELAEQAIRDPKITDEQRIKCLRSKGEALSSLGRLDEALPPLLEAKKLAEATGMRAMQPGSYNDLIDIIVLVYLKRGENNSARLMARNKH